MATEVELGHGLPTCRLRVAGPLSNIAGHGYGATVGIGTQEDGRTPGGAMAIVLVSTRHAPLYLTLVPSCPARPSSSRSSRAHAGARGGGGRGRRGGDKMPECSERVGSPAGRGGGSARPVPPLVRSGTPQASAAGCAGSVSVGGAQSFAPSKQPSQTPRDLEAILKGESESVENLPHDHRERQPRHVGRIPAHEGAPGAHVVEQHDRVPVWKV